MSPFIIVSRYTQCPMYIIWNDTGCEATSIQVQKWDCARERLSHSPLHLTIKLSLCMYVFEGSAAPSQRSNGAMPDAVKCSINSFERVLNSNARRYSMQQLPCHRTASYIHDIHEKHTVCNKSLLALGLRPTFPTKSSGKNYGAFDDFSEARGFEVTPRQLESSDFPDDCSPETEAKNRTFCERKQQQILGCRTLSTLSHLDIFGIRWALFEF